MIAIRRTAALLMLVAAPCTVLTAQDTTVRADQGVRVGIQYTPGVRPGLVVLPARGLDSARAIIARDLDYSDRFEVTVLPAGPVAEPPARGARAAEPNLALYAKLGAALALELTPVEGGVRARLFDVAANRLRNDQTFAVPAVGAPGWRMALHRVSDEVVRWGTGTPGIAATRLLLLAGGRVWRVDSDGADLAPVTPEGQQAMSPTWAPDGTRIAYTVLANGRGSILVRNLATGATVQVPSTGSGLNFAAAFAPDGRTLAFARADESGTDLYTANVAEQCCVQRLTVGKFADNLSPTFSPDGRRIAYISTRAGPPQVYVMDADGTDQELLAPFDFGVTGGSFAPEWSPDGASVIFHREVSRSPQLFVVDVAGRRVRQLTSQGRNEDGTWAPDGRHVAFISDRSGRRQIWVIDLETGRVRQIATPGAARLPSWSRRFGAVPLP